MAGESGGGVRQVWERLEIYSIYNIYGIYIPYISNSETLIPVFFPSFPNFRPYGGNEKKRKKDNGGQCHYSVDTCHIRRCQGRRKTGGGEIRNIQYL